ncbi:Dolichol-phosphate mannosyltransferase [Neolecta irregularis DAH-3]|uniref:Dolichol-phosphate mannosyltransferase subunit 1 n=1 Tax=Neolecta irregularis (strain DAH-3) TaxID=1198029 RepID=A0A1U7LNV9_NEOID|nr:Dolichol-phosphate mannosyltransferase [Neolecta irregularis DAH-3]|eukprot:OLL24337.1 Dolichol-phosphate mannosyltransferase [Neolecta irregularis DAH-3]
MVRTRSSQIKASIIVPTYKENENLRSLTKRLFQAIASSSYSHWVELIVVDDNSNDGSAETVAELQKEGYNVRIVVRTTERGLSSAVVRGFQESQGEYLVCMDADLQVCQPLFFPVFLHLKNGVDWSQHPPECIPALLALLDDSSFVQATRYHPSSRTNENWPLYRKIISEGARVLARPLTSVSDPMSGLFGIKKEYFLKAKDMNPLGFKIALDLLVKSNIPFRAIAEFPFDFGVRQEGESKLTGKVMLRYLEQLAELYFWKFGYSLILFLLVILVLVMFLLAKIAGFM